METEQKAAQQAPAGQAPEKFCKHCGGKIPADAVVCTLCGRQVEQMAQSGAPNIVINNANQNTNSNVNAYVAAKARNKWVAPVSYTHLWRIVLSAVLWRKNDGKARDRIHIGVFGRHHFRDKTAVFTQKSKTCSGRK